MPRHYTAHARFRKTLLALAAGAALAPHGAWALELAQSPPGTVEPYVRPNVIITFDDSGSMKYQTDATTSGTADGIDRSSPNADGSWPINTQRISILKYAVKQVFNDVNLLPNKKIRLAWQTMHNNGYSENGAGKGKFPDADNVNTTGAHNMRVLDDTHRKNFLDFVGWMKPNGGTPTHKMAYQAHKYMTEGSLDQNNPWSSVPGTTGPPYLGCRRNYHILMSDGGWQTAPSGSEKPGNADGANFTLPDTTVYNKVRPYTDVHTDMVADWAFKSWSTKLRSDLDGSPQPDALYRKAPTTENFGKDKTGKDAILDRYWNPRYNPATWPHMVTYTIGFSKAATTWNGEPNIKRPPDDPLDENIVPFSYDIGKNGSLPDFITGVNNTFAWPLLTTGSEKTKNPLDLWHSALNGRGRYYAVEKGEQLQKAFEDIFKQINTQTEPDLTSTATSGSNSSRNDVGKFTGAYEPKNAWKGFVSADTVRKDGTTVPNTGWAGKNTADKLDALDASGLNNRLVLSWSNKWVSTSYKGGVPFKWASDEANLSIAQKALLGLNPGDPGVTVATNGQNRLNFIRGDRSLEGSDTSGYTTAKPFRERKSRQGDIINSVVWYTGAPSASYALNGYAAFLRCTKARQPMIYVGGNDGMLHGFAASDGAEKIAYVPNGMVPNLPLLSNPVYNNQHRSFVDGSPMTGDVDTGTGVVDPNDPCNTNGWRTMLVGTLGAGGKGYFVLDVTNPAATAGSAPAFLESNATQLVKLDRTRSIEPGTAPNCALSGMGVAEKAACTAAENEDRDIGHITARPVQADTDPMRATQIARMNNNRWAVVLGNGYNSANQRPVLLVQYLDGAKELLRIATTTDTPGTGKAADNGLSAPRLVDINGDGTPDVAYAGDNLGNLWKFDLTNVDATQWGVAFGGSPLFTAKGPASLGNASRTKVQPITVAPMVRANDRLMAVGTGASATTVAVGGMMVAFGTGRNVGKDDASSIDVQTLYSVLDNTRYRTVVTAQGKRLEVHPGGGTCPGGANCVPAPAALGEGVTIAKLAQQKLTDVSGGYATVDVVNDLKQSSWGSYNGWYLDLPAVGERLLKPMESHDGSNIMNVFSQVPAKGSDVDPNIESCDSSSVDEERQRKILVNIMDGKRSTVPLIDMNGDGFFTTADNDVSSSMVSKGSHSNITNGTKIDDIDSKNFRKSYARMPEQSLRPSWRQLK